MKKLLSFCAILVIALGFVACSQDSVDSTEGETLVELSNDTQVFTIEAISAASLLGYSSVETLSLNQLSEDLVEDDIVEEEIDEIDQYLTMMETYLGDNNGLTVNSLVSDKEGYSNLVSFTTVDAYGNQVEYYLYYNETIYEQPTVLEGEVTTVEEPVEEPTQRFQFMDVNDEFVEYLLTGLIIFNDIEYEVEGKKISTPEGDSITILRAFVDSDNCVRVSYKVDDEDNNTKFFFQIKEAGVITNRSRVHIVNTEEGATVVHLDFQDEMQVARYTFRSIESEGVTLIHIKYDIRLLESNTRESGNIHIEASVNPETGELVYTYKILGQAKGKANKVIEKRRKSTNSSTSRNNKVMFNL